MIELSIKQALEIINTSYCDDAIVVKAYNPIIDKLLLKFIYYNEQFDIDDKLDFVEVLKLNNILVDLIIKAKSLTEVVNLSPEVYRAIAEDMILGGSVEFLDSFISSFETDEAFLIFLDIQSEIFKEHEVQIDVTDASLVDDVARKVLLCNIAMCKVCGEEEEVIQL